MLFRVRIQASPFFVKEIGKFDKNESTQPRFWFGRSSVGTSAQRICNIHEESFSTDVYENESIYRLLQRSFQVKWLAFLLEVGDQVTWVDLKEGLRKEVRKDFFKKLTLYSLN